MATLDVTIYTKSDASNRLFFLAQLERFSSTDVTYSQFHYSASIDKTFILLFKCKLLIEIIEN